jgi:hypothetical protein
MSVQTPFGLLEGRIVSPAEVSSGLLCGCCCPGCGARLIARKGSRMWCFAHYQAEGSRSCLETAIHSAGKQALLDAGHLMVPSFQVEETAVSADGEMFCLQRTLGVARRIRCEKMVAEVFMDGVRPDVVGYRGTRALLLEVFVTHQVDAHKMAKLAVLGLPVLEINLSDLPSLGIKLGLEAVRERVIEGTAHKQWLVYPGAVAVRTHLQAELMQQVALAEGKARQQAMARVHRAQALERERERRAAARERRGREAAARSAAEQAAYRALPEADKERRLRTALGLQGAWPAHLNDARFHTPALSLPCHLWQGLFYEHFILQCRGGLDGFAVTEFDTWARTWVGIGDNGFGRADSALRAFADFLFARGILERCRSARRNAVLYYRVPSRQAIPQRAVTDATSTPTPAVPAWRWRDRWPRAAELLANAEAQLVDNPHQDVLMAELDDLDPLTCPLSPDVFAARLAKQGVPEELTLRVIAALRLAERASWPPLAGGR